MEFDIVYAVDLEKTLKESRGILLDIREPKEYAKEHWPLARSFPYEELERGYKRLPKNRRIIIYCEHGGGSMQMARMLGKEGYHVATVVGGYEAMKKVNRKTGKNF